MFAGPTTRQRHIDIQPDLTNNTVAAAAYVGRKGTHLMLQRNINQLFAVAGAANPFHPGRPLSSTICNTVSGAWTNSVAGVVNGQTVTGRTAQDLAVACGSSPADPYRPSQGYSNITLIEPQGNSSYNSMQVSVRRTAAKSQLTLLHVGTLHGRFFRPL
jgi:hypothetical protein